MKVAIVTDSNSGIFPAKGKELGIFVLPMPFMLDSVEHFEGVDMTHEAFYKQLEADADATTSQPSPADVENLWNDILGQGYDQIVHIPMSSGLSASCATAQGLAADFDGKVFVVDDHRVSITLYDAVMDAIAMAKEGMDAPAIKAELEAGGMDSVIYLGVDTLKYFKKNGRCTAATAALGTVLNLKPILKCDGERFDAIAKVRGVANCRKQVVEAAVKAVEEMQAKGYSVSVGVAGSFLDMQDAKDWMEQFCQALPGVPIHCEPLSFSVICHTGPNAFGVGVSRRLRP